MNKPTSNPMNPPSRVPRRHFLKLTAMALGAATLIGCGSKPEPAAAPSETAEVFDLETTSAKLGFIALTDAAPLFVALEKGFFAKHGMTNVEVIKQSSWGATRDNLVLGGARGGIDGAHILTPMPYLISTGAVTANNVPMPMSILARLNLGGQCISVSNEHAGLGITTDASAFGKAIAAKRASGADVNAANTFPGGTHDVWIRYWMAAAGIDPDLDINVITIPPAQMVANMKVGSMEAFCVCEPWNKQLISQGIGFTALTTSELWGNHPEKSFAMRTDFVEANPKATQALLKAVMEAQMYCEDPANIEEIAEICSRRRYINAPFEDIIDRMHGNFDYGDGRVVENSPYRMRYWNDFASYPFQSHDLWFITENQRWGQLPADLDTKELIRRVNREDLWRAAAKELGIPEAEIPTSTSRGVETFFDGKVFDPEDPKSYLDSLEIKRI